MISFQVCKKCEHCTYEKAEHNDEGDMVIPPSVLCSVSGNILYMMDEAPNECDYYLEHILYSDGVPEEVAEKLSGYGDLEEVAIELEKLNELNEFDDE